LILGHGSGHSTLIQSQYTGLVDPDSEPSRGAWSPAWPRRQLSSARGNSTEVEAAPQRTVAPPGTASGRRLLGTAGGMADYAYTDIDLIYDAARD
jgi:hypothetical protein